MPVRLFLAALASVIGAGLVSPVLAQDLRERLRAGGKLTPEKAESLEAELGRDPENLFARAELLGYYARQVRDDSARARRHEHVLWLIKNAPGTNALDSSEAMIAHRLYPKAYQEATRLWTAHLESNPNNLAILRNAAQFHTLGDRTTAIQLLERAQALDDRNPLWARELGHLHSLDMQSSSGPPDTDAAAQALAQFERAIELSDERSRDRLLEGLAKAALTAGEVEKAREYAESMLSRSSRSWNRGTLVHHGHLTLGTLALAEGRLEEAKNRLVSAGGTPGAPTLNSFGPNMALARELVELGEREIVLEYFELCAKFWNTSRAKDKLRTWSEQVANGKIPDFGANLIY